MSDGRLATDGEEVERGAVALCELLATTETFLSSVSHELGTPLMIATWSADALRRGLDGSPLAEEAEAVSVAAERCMRLVNNFFEAVRRRRPERGPVALNRLVEDAVELLGHALRIARIETVLDLEERLPPVEADPNHLRQVLLALVAGAHERLRGAPPPRRLHIASRSGADGARVALEMTCTGKAPAHWSLSAFPLCCRIVTEHGGTFTVSGPADRDSVVRIELPGEEHRRSP